MSTILDAARLRRVFGTGERAFTAVDRVSLRVSSGEIHALLGPNGAGKTTTVQMCSTLLTPTGGSLTALMLSLTRSGRAVTWVSRWAGRTASTREPVPAIICCSSPMLRGFPGGLDDTRSSTL